MLKPKYLLYPLVAALLLAGCGDDSSDNSSPLDSRNSYITYNNAMENNGTYDIHENNGTLTSPLKDKFINSYVLNQGQSNTCTTFSVIGTIGTLIKGSSEYYGIKCSLNLGNSLNVNNNYQQYSSLNNIVYRDNLKYYPSGWHGTYTSIVVEQIKQFGLTLKNATDCGYDSFDVENGHNNYVSVQQYEGVATDITEKIEFQDICSNIDNSIPSCDSMDSSVDAIKNIIDSNGTAIVSFKTYAEDGYGLNKIYQYFSFESLMYPDVWSYSDITKACDDGSKSCAKAEHEVAIFGFIDASSGSSKDSLLVIRNSWGEDAGDNGNYYMTYEYADNMIQTVSSIKTK